MKKLAYIAGAISKDKANYKRRFKAVENYLAALGFQVFNPAEQETSPVFSVEEWTRCMKKDIKMLMMVDIVYFIPTWWKSKGALIEMFLCIVLQIPKVMISRKDQSFIEKEYL